MSDASTKKMISAYLKTGTPSMFLSSLFQSPAQNFHNSETIEIDIQRSGEDVAIVVQDLSTGYRMNSDDLFTNKEFTPPIFKEAGALNAFDMIKRMVGQNPFDDPAFQSNAIVKSFQQFRKLEAKIKRAMELQASQALQTGTITLIDQSGNALYTIDFKPKATHFPTVVTAWDQAGATPLADIEAVSEVIRDDGLEGPTQLLMGSTSFNAFIANDDVQKHYDNRRIDQGTISNTVISSDAGNFRGIVTVGNYQYDIWTYGGRYVKPDTGVTTQFLEPDKVIVRSGSGRLDATFGSIPRIAPPDSRALPFLPSRIRQPGVNFDLTTNAWITPDGEQVFVGAGTRPLMIPTAIDTFGCITTGV